MAAPAILVVEDDDAIGDGLVRVLDGPLGGRDGGDDRRKRVSPRNREDDPVGGAQLQG